MGYTGMHFAHLWSTYVMTIYFEIHTLKKNIAYTYNSMVALKLAI